MKLHVQEQAETGFTESLIIIKLKITGRISRDTPDFHSPSSPTAMRLT